jgi:hypothetical protein
MRLGSPTVDSPDVGRSAAVPLAIPGSTTETWPLFAVVPVRTASTLILTCSPPLDGATESIGDVPVAASWLANQRGAVEAVLGIVVGTACGQSARTTYVNLPGCEMSRRRDPPAPRIPQCHTPTSEYRPADPRIGVDTL